MTYSNQSTNSSPDPLGISHNTLELSSPLKPRRETPNLTPKKVLGETNNNVRLHDIYLSTSPAAKKHYGTPNKGGAAQPPISPWRIRVIVQAEPENDNIVDAKHMIQPFMGRTVTTVVPLKEAAESVAAAERRIGATPQKKLFGKRRGTPRPTGAGQDDITSMSSLQNKNDQISRVATTPKRSRGRPRKSPGKPSETRGEEPENHNTMTHVSQLDNLSELGLLGNTTASRRRGRKKASTPRKQVAQPKVGPQGSAQPLQPGLKTNEEGADSQQFNRLKRKMDTTTASDDHSRVKRSHVVVSSPKTDSNQTLARTSRFTQEYPTKHGLPNRENIYTRGNVSASELSPPLHTQHHGELGSQAVADLKMKSITRSQSTGSHQFSDPPNEHHEFDSILESEGFSMITVSTLPSGNIGLNSARNGHQGTEGEEDGEVSLRDDPSQPILSSGWQQSSEAAAEYQLEALSQDKEEVLSVSSVKNTERLESHQTPSCVPLDPSNLPLLRLLGNQNVPRVLDEVTDSTPKIVRVVRAGTALQGVVGPPQLAEGYQTRSNQELDASKSSRAGLEPDYGNLFDGFGAGTQRELRAGLRLGEELAKSLPGRTSQTSPGNTPLEHNNPTQTTNSLGSSRPKENLVDDLTVPNTGQDISYPAISNNQLPSPDRSDLDTDEDQMSFDAEMPAQVEEGTGEDHDSLVDGDIDDISYNSHNRTMEREAEWQREREAVVRQIEMANSSRVIILDGDTVLQDEEHSQPEDMGHMDEERSQPEDMGHMDEERSQQEDMGHMDEEYSQLGDMGQMDETDIWQAAARSPDVDPKYSNHQSIDKIPNQVSKPRRSRIPSPWRRQERLGPAVQGDVGSDLFWQPGRAAGADSETNVERNSSRDASGPGHTVRLSELIESDHREQVEKDSRSVTEPNPASSEVVDTSSKDGSLDDSLDGGEGEAQSPVAALDSVESGEVTACQQNETEPSPKARSSRITICQTETTKVAKPNDQSRSRTTSEPVATASSISWLRYITSFFPGWTQPAPPKPLPELPNDQPQLPNSQRRLPNGHRRLPVAISEGPLCLYLPWTLDHWRALYVHYAAAREGRATFRFNPSGPTAWHVGICHYYREWYKPITQEDSAIADAFLADLRRRGVASLPHSGEMIDDYKVLGMLFYIWKAGVINGECEVGVGRTGWRNGTEEWWRPDMEPWYRG